MDRTQEADKGRQTPHQNASSVFARAVGAAQLRQHLHLHLHGKQEQGTQGEELLRDAHGEA